MPFLLRLLVAWAVDAAALAVAAWIFSGVSVGQCGHAELLPEFAPDARHDAK